MAHNDVDVIATVRHALLGACIETCGVTGLRFGEATEALISAIVDAIRSPATVWAFHELLGESPDDALCRQHVVTERDRAWEREGES